MDHYHDIQQFLLSVTKKENRYILISVAMVVWPRGEAASIEFVRKVAEFVKEDIEIIDGNIEENMNLWIKLVCEWKTNLENLLSATMGTVESARLLTYLMVTMDQFGPEQSSKLFREWIGRMKCEDGMTVTEDGRPLYNFVGKDSNFGNNDLGHITYSVIE